MGFLVYKTWLSDFVLYFYSCIPQNSILFQESVGEKSSDYVDMLWK